MDWELLEAAIALSLLEHAAAVGVEFDGSDAAVAEQHAAEDSAPDAREEVEFMHGCRAWSACSCQTLSARICPWPR